MASILLRRVTQAFTPSQAPLVGNPRPSEVTRSAISLKEASLLRATPIREVLKLSGRILGSSAGSAETYRLSHVTERIHTFISHNWSTGRYVKFATLALHFEHLWAFAVSFAVTMMAMLLAYLHWLPALVPLAGCWYCKILGVPAFLLSLLFGRHVWVLLGFSGPSVFLDKICIHQTDKDIQRQGIESLGAFLCSSSEMVVVFADTYLHKLWTVYELATFLCVCSSSRLILCPPFLVKIVGAFLALDYTWWIVWGSALALTGRVRPDDLPFYLEVVLQTFVVMIYFLKVLVFRMWAREQQRLRVDIRSFCTKDAKCFCEDDRPLVNNNIVAFVKSNGYCDASAHNEVALRAFDSVVHKDVPPALAVSMGRVGIPYRYILMMCQGPWWLHCDIACGMILDGEVSKQHFLAHLVHSVGHWMAFWPLVVAFIVYLTRRSMRFSGWQECAIIFLHANITCLVTFVVARKIMLPLWKYACDSEKGFCLLVGFHCILSCLTYWCFRDLTLEEVLATQASEEDLSEEGNRPELQMATLSRRS